jgi:hypothetical protein
MIASGTERVPVTFIILPFKEQSDQLKFCSLDTPEEEMTTKSGKRWKRLGLRNVD